ncbi:hypothetical protein ASC70_21335 [Caulobacter sp. Root343]|nr:hypothetical protein ASC62_21310 [Caulobacter sp. Root342]KQV63638.1 hypothetical protein ASC70_21335 [Caulobacter sp. Root343]
MPIAVLLVDDLGPHRARCLSVLSKRFSLSLLEVRRSIEHGQPVVTRNLFDRQTPPFAEIFAEALAEMEALECRYRAFEVSEGQVWTSLEGYYQLTPERLRNMIGARRISLEHQRQLGELEDRDPT